MTATARIPGSRVNTWPIADRVPFKTSGALEAELVSYTPSSYRLPREHHDALRDDEVDYVVTSYGTPIAWHGKRGWVIPDVKYSVTTSTHQNRVRDALRGEEVLTA